MYQLRLIRLKEIGLNTVADFLSPTGFIVNKENVDLDIMSQNNIDYVIRFSIRRLENVDEL